MSLNVRGSKLPFFEAPSFLTSRILRLSRHMRMTRYIVPIVLYLLRMHGNDCQGFALQCFSLSNASVSGIYYDVTLINFNDIVLEDF